MDPHIRHWKVAIERFCAASDPDYREIAKLIAVIAMTEIDRKLPRRLKTASASGTG